jgi:hypothetical protein
MTLRFIKIISVCFYGGSESLQISYRLFVNVLALKFQLSRGKGWDSIYLFTPQHVCVCSGTIFRFNGIMTVLMKAIIRIQIYFQLIICLFDLLKQSNENKSCTDQKLNGT